MKIGRKEIKLLVIQTLGMLSVLLGIALSPPFLYYSLDFPKDGLAKLTMPLYLRINAVAVIYHLKITTHELWGAFVVFLFLGLIAFAYVATMYEREQWRKARLLGIPRENMGNV